MLIKIVENYHPSACCFDINVLNRRSNFEAILGWFATNQPIS